MSPVSMIVMARSARVKAAAPPPFRTWSTKARSSASAAPWKSPTKSAQSPRYWVANATDSGSGRVAGIDALLQNWRRRVPVRLGERQIAGDPQRLRSHRSVLAEARQEGRQPAAASLRCPRASQYSHRSAPMAAPASGSPFSMHQSSAARRLSCSRAMRSNQPGCSTSVPLFGAAMLVGWTMQSRRLRYDALEREQGEATLRAAADERLRIAQELHDVIGHSLGVIAVQAGVGMHLIERDPAEAKRALEHISRTSRSSLAEIRRLLGLVRSGEGASVYAPTPGLADLPRLVEEVTGAGLPVDLTVGPDARELPSGVELAAYRVVQEALTNVRKHARARRATVHVDVDAGTLHIVVTDDGTGSSNGGRRRGGGHGLVGMQERVAVYGGSLEAGPGVDGGFRVAATLPYDEQAP